jgi:hypothetical protein
MVIDDDFSPIRPGAGNDIVAVLYHDRQDMVESLVAAAPIDVLGTAAGLDFKGGFRAAVGIGHRKARGHNVEGIGHLFGS